ncbi:single-stranded DNA-binding protein [Gloeocapsopsis dulcis]|uniref:Single-stranded DNA-binding protein n=1 Tax=Gloeocapsopsis dulcis AAB1 = 1H9 TaxID=1433147 RepID=A0A6N8FR48_9CHRO|nr:single-stranded DNA-binding protein [Gloeocapsopsis dulcis]MUL35254.1 single-stranded DNA-binding protein [Gloeocapsopsis dulcis AAB1 = 1H9]WNN89136.1 single-stranded DNA-binding protein [Gloeocapsopsis dulcis]
MNSCILMAEIVQAPQLRYTSDNMALAEMLIQFPGLRAEDSPATLKAVGWGNLAQEIEQHYQQGDRVIIEGRLTMNTFERSEGFKEKRAELTVQRIHAVDKTVDTTATKANPKAAPDAVTRSEKAPKANLDARTPAATTSTASRTDVIADFATYEPPTRPSSAPLPPSEDQDIDDIPF